MGPEKNNLFTSTNSVESAIMNSAVLFVAALVAVSSAYPQTAPAASPAALPHPVVVAVPKEDAARNPISDLVASLLERASAYLKEQGLDPFIYDKFEAGYALPVPSLFNVNLDVSDVRLFGLSNIVINRLSYGILSQRLTFDFSIPEIVFELGDLNLDVVVLSHLMQGKANGKVTITNVGVDGTVRVTPSIVSGIAIRELLIYFYIDGLNSEIDELNILGVEISSQVNDFVNDPLLAAIIAHNKDIGEMIAIIVEKLIERFA
ncbi:unnamed protein product [Plutella xylostella]|uniref:(diamondback moth) hypothetical protein n=1 Tax=Plutella xylostella TaxID=51655 RepID=A0A8S4E6L2_PLUXY|nr:unnamed protein product [Plutella xylostella]